MSSTNTTPGGGSRLDEDRKTAEGTVRQETQSARQEAGKIGETVRTEAASLAEGAKQKAVEGVEQGKSAAASSLEDFTAAVRKASEELGDRDQSMAAGLVRQAATGLEQASEALKGQSVSDLTRSVADFARRQPTAFLLGATLAGVALGRFARASSDHANPLSSDGSNERGGRANDDWRRSGEDRSYDRNRFAEAGQRSGARYGGGSGTHGASSSSGSYASGASTIGGSSYRGSNPASTSSQADAVGGGTSASSGGNNPTPSTLNKPGTSGSTETAGLSGSSAGSPSSGAFSSERNTETKP